jgi:hypothetical protein
MDEVERIFLIIKAQRECDVSQIHLGDIAVDVVLKDIKNVHLSVHPPTAACASHRRTDASRHIASSRFRSSWIHSSR